MKIRLKHIGFLLTLLLSGVICGRIYSQNNLEFLTVEDGLSQGYITNIIQDKEGFLWFGTINGLNRYDGYEFKIFTSNPLDSFSISGNHIRSVFEFGDYLLVGTAGCGLNIFNKKTHQFLKVKGASEISDWLIHGSFSSISRDKNGQFWARINTLGEENGILLIKFDLKIYPDKFAQILQYELTPAPDATDFYFKPKSQTIHGVNGRKYFQMHVDSTLKWLDFPEQLKSENDFLKHSDGWLYNSTQMGIFEEGTWRFLKLNFKITSSIFPNEETRSFFLITPNKEVYRFPLSTINKNVLNISDGEFVFQFSNKELTSFFKDNSGIYWIGTNGHGLIKINPHKLPLQVIIENRSVNEQVHIDYEKRFGYKSRTNIIWTNSINGHDLLSFPQPLERQMFSKLSPNGDYWVASVYHKKLWLYRKKFQTENWEMLFSQPFPEHPDRNEYVRLEFGPENDIQIVTLKSLVFFHPYNQTFQEYKLEGELPEIWEVNASAITGDGSTWIGAKEGLIRAKKNGDNFDFHLFQVENGNPDGVLNNYISCLLTDPTDNQILWIGSLGGGISRLDVRTMQFKHFNTQNGFPDNVVYSLLDDEKGQFWMGTNRGLVRFNPKNQTTKTYTFEDGLPSNEFNIRSYGKALDGTLFFGNVKGLISLNPNEITDNEFTPKVHFTGLKINNQTIVFGNSTGILNQSMEFTKTLTLPYSQNNLTLEFAGMEFSVPTKNTFRYYLNGAEKSWAHETTERRATYLNLQPGNYTFIVKAANSDGIWHKEKTALNIKILPPWWRSNWAFFGYFLILVGIGFGILRFFLYRQKLKHRIALEQRESERLKELDAFKNRLYTNITHEFRTPLTVILGMASELVDGERLTVDGTTGKKELGLIKENGEKLLNLINQMLDLAKLEEQSMSLNMESGDVILFLKYLTNTFLHFAVRENITLHFESDAPNFEMDFDRAHLQTVLTNLLSNALKYTPSGGNIFVEVEKKAKALDALKTLKITVRDTGTGIPKHQLTQIFDRFYRIEKIENQVEGTGIGLTLTKELVHLMSGEISVESEVDKGTEFTITLPITNAEISNTENRQPTTDNEKPTLLIIEDDYSIREYLLTCVSENYQVLTAKNGKKGIELALKNVPDLIVSDVMMPQKDGFEVAAILKNDERTSHIPIILLTAKVDDISKIEGLERGADAYLAKPFNKTELLVRLRKLLELRKRLQEKYGSSQLAVSSWQSDGGVEDEFIKRVQNAVFENLENESFGITDLCKKIGASRTQLHNKLKALTGKSTSLYIRFLRLQKARELLLTTDLNVSEVASEVGFKYLQHFSKFYSEEFGEQPSKTRP